MNKSNFDTKSPDLEYINKPKILDNEVYREWDFPVINPFLLIVIITVILIFLNLI